MPAPRTAVPAPLLLGLQPGAGELLEQRPAGQPITHVGGALWGDKWDGKGLEGVELEGAE